jgi:hypothetical protein
LLEETAPSNAAPAKKGLSEHLGRLLREAGVPGLEMDPGFEPTPS